MFIISKHSALSSTRQDVFLILTASAAVPPRTQSAAQLPSLAPHDSKARLRTGMTRRRFMAKPCTPYPIPQAEQLFKPGTANQTLSLGGQRGIFSFRGKRISPLFAPLRVRRECGAAPSALLFLRATRGFFMPFPRKNSHASAAWAVPAQQQHPCRVRRCRRAAWRAENRAVSC